MKKNVIAMLLAFVIASNSIGTVPVIAAETTTQESVTVEEDAVEESEQESTEVTEESDTANETEMTEDVQEDDSADIADTSIETAEVEEPVVVAEGTTTESEGEEAKLAGEGDIVDSGTCGENATWILSGADDNLTLTISGSGKMKNYSIRPGDNNFAPWNGYISRIKTLIIENDITYIGSYAFYFCENLSSVSIPESLTGKGWGCFLYCYDLYDDNNMIIINNVLFECFGTSEIVYIPDGITRIGDYAFWNNYKVHEVVLPDGVISIGIEAFEYCRNLEKISFPDTLIEIGREAFYGCESLKTVINIPKNMTVIGPRAFKNSAITGINIPDGVVEIGECAFTNCIGLENIVIPEGVTTIGSSAFSSCHNLVSVSLPSTVSSMGTFTFSSCSKLENIVLPDALNRIEASTFNECYGLKSITIPSGVTHIGNDLCSYCSDLKIYFTGPAPIFGSSVFRSASVTVYYPMNDSTWNSSVFRDYDGNVTWAPWEPTEIGVIADGACGPNLTWTLDEEGTLTISGTGWMDDYDITSTNLPPWFEHSAEIKRIVIEDGVTTIGVGAFAATSIKRIIIPDSIVEIGEYAFFACKSLVSASIGTGVYYLESYTFAECDTFTAVYFSKKNKIEISPFAFEGCGDITGYYPEGCGEDWFISETEVFGAASFLWNCWLEGEESITFDQNEYTCEVGETIHISGYYESDCMVFINAETKEDNNSYIQNEFQWMHDTWYDGLFFCDITGKNIGRGKITLTCETGIGQVSVDVFINVVEPDGETPITEPFEAFFINQTYKFHNLNDPIIGPSYYLFFKPAQASILEKMKLGTGGQCFGMVYSAVSTETFYSPSVNSYSGATWLREVNKEQVSSETGISASEYIKYAHLYQYTPTIQRKREMNRRSGLQGLYTAVADMNNGGKPVEIGMWNIGKNDGHSLLARGIKKNTENRTEILVYDCNYPLNRNCILTLYKTDGEFTSWEYVRSGYEYKSQNGAIIKFTMDYESFMEEFNGEKEDEASYSHLIMTPSIGTSISNQAGDEFSLYGDNDTNIEKLLPIHATEAEGETAPGDLYWIDIGDTFTINAPSEESHYEIAADYHTVELTLPGESAAELTVSDETENKVEISIPDTDEAYTVLFSETDDEGEQLNTYSISGTSGSVVSAQATDDGVIVSGNDLGTLEIITPETTTVYTVPEEDDGVIISESGNTKPIKLISEKTKVVISDAACVYNGKEIKPSITVTDENNNLLKEGTDYTVAYENNIYPGTATVTITGIGDYIGTIESTFLIEPQSITPVISLTEYSFTYTGASINPQVTVSLNGEQLVEDVDYTLSYENNIEPGTAMVIVTCIGNYSGSATKEFTINKVLTGLWKKDRTGWWYLWEDGTYPKNKFEIIEGVTYYFNPSGYMVTGWRSIDGKWYYFNASGAMMIGWQKLGGVWYYMNSNGAMVTGWQSIGGVWYYFNNSGAMQTGWRQLGGVWYYMNPSGAMVTGWQSIGGKWYYFNASGAMMTGWQQIGDVWYYMNSSGAMVTGWLKLGNTWYYMNASGAMVTGRQQIDGTWYTFSSSGAMQ